MIFFYMILLILMLALEAGARISKLSIPKVNKGYSKPFLGTAVLLHMWKDKMLKIVPGGYGPGHVTKKRQLVEHLQTLYPGESSETQMYRYSVERLSAMLLILGVGAMIAMGISFTAMENRALKDGHLIYRESFGGVDKDVSLTAGIQGEYEDETDMEILVSARKYSAAEADELFEKMSDEIDVILLADNDNANNVTGNLNTVKNVDGYPFSISWESSNCEYLEPDGTVHNEGLEEPVAVTLTGDCLYEHAHRYLIRTVTIRPHVYTTGELIRQELEKAVDKADTASESDEIFTLPESISYGMVSWEEAADDQSLLIVILAVLVCIALIPMSEVEIASKLKKRQRALLIEYPAFVSKLTLYLGAGMSLRNAFLRMGHTAAASKNKGSDPLDMELMITAHELETGISEREAYENLGKRCGTREYIRFSTLITQNLRKGSTDLIRLLREESEDAFELRKNEARKLGEEASTKLLVPMVMMLGVVMMIIMIPAYMSFSN